MTDNSEPRLLLYGLLAGYLRRVRRQIIRPHGFTDRIVGRGDGAEEMAGGGAI